MKISTDNLQICYPKGFLSSSSYPSFRVSSAYIFSLDIAVGHSWDDYILTILTIDEFHILRSTVTEAFKPTAYLGITVTGFTDFARFVT